jgi:hypothetical protein
MADMQTLYRALQNAHAAGDVQAATQLATYIKSMQGQAEPIPAEPTFLGSAKAAAVRGFEAVPESASGIGLGIKAALGMRESASKQAEDIRAQAQAEAGKPQGTSFADLEKAYQEQGLMAAAKKVPSYITEQALQSAPSMAVPLAAGASAAAFAGPLAPVVGPAVGIGTYGLQQFGNFMRRQAEEGRTGETLEPGKAFGTAAATAPIGYFADRLILGFGKVPEKILGQQVAAELAKRAGVRAATGATVGVVAEAPTEVLEQMGERWQAGLPLKGDDAMREYKEAFFGGAALGGVGGAASGALRKPAVTPKEEPPAYQPPVSLTGKTPAEMFQEQAAGRQGMGADVLGAVREREAAAAKAKQDELDAQRATQERAAGLFEQQAAPRNEDLMQAARVRADEKAAADEELRVQAEKEAKAKRDAEAKAAAAATYSGDPAINAIRRDEQLATLGYQMSRDKQGNDIVIPTPPPVRDIAAERAAQEAKIAEGRRADEVRQSLAGTTANEDLMASIRQRQADQAAAATKAEQDKKTAETSDVQARVRGVMATQYSRDPIMNNVRQREALGELGYELKLDKKGNLTPQPKQEAAPTVTPTPPLTLEKPPETPPVTTTPEVREEYPPLTQAEVDELGLIPPAKVVKPKEPKVDYFNHPDNIGHDAAEKRELDNKGKLQVAPQPITEGGVPFTSRKSADMARKNYPEMRVLPNKNGKGFILAPKTPKQIAADEAKAKRLGLAKTSATGTPMSAHEYITSEGGIVKTEMSDLGMDKNVRVGNRFLFAGDGKGLTMEEAYTKLQEAGYLGENATQNDARNMITDSVKKPKYRPQDEEAMAKRDEEKRFEDYRKAEEEASLYSPVDEELGYEMSDFDGTGYEAADPDIQAEVRALLAQADELGIDTESMREEVFYETETQSVQAYYKAFRSALEGAIDRGREDSVQDTGEPSDAGAELTLTQPTAQEIIDKQDAAIKAEKDRKAADRAAEEKAKADEAAADFTLTGSDRDADVAASRGQKDIFGEEAMLRDATPEQIAFVDAGAEGVNGQVVWQRKDVALVRGWNKRTGNPVYVAIKGFTRNNFDIDTPQGANGLTSAETKELRQVKLDLETADAQAEAENPFIKFNKDGLAFSKNMPPKIAGVVKGWKEQLGLTNNIYITTIPDARVDAHNMTGQWRAVGSAALDYRQAGTMRQMPNGDYYIAMTPSSSITSMLEIMAHELGHMHQFEVFNKAPAETQAAIKAEYDKWLASTKGKTARELVNSLRAKTTAKTTDISEGAMAANMDPYWFNFKEWYADQVSRWALTSDKPVGVVEQFFKRLADSLRAFYTKAKNAGYLPNETFKKYLEAANAAAQKSKDMTVPPIIAEDAQMEMFMLKEAGESAAKVAASVKAAAQQKLQKREPINREALSDLDADYVEKLGAVFNPQTKTIIDRIAGLQDGFWRRAAQGIADQYRTIKDYSEEAYMMARLSKTVDGALEGLLMHGHVYNNGGALDIKGQTKGLFEAMKPVGAETDRYMMWVALGREARLPLPKRSPNLAPLLADRDQLVQGDINGRPRLEVYQEVQKDMNALNKSVLDVAYNAGLMDQKAYERFSQDLFYIPFYKQMESGDLQDAATASGLTSQKFSAELKGQSDKPFGDLMENTLRNWSHILSASMKNQASNATLDAAMEAGAAIPNLKVGLAWEDGKVVSSKSGEVVGDGSLRAEYTEAGKGIVKTMMNGQPAYFEVLDPMLLDSITSIGYLGPKSKFLDVARDFKNLLQYGVTMSPAFKVNNLIRDSIQAIAVSDLKRNPFANVIEGWAATDKNNPAHISALAGGAIFNFGSAYEGDQSKLIKRLLAQGVKGEHILDTQDKIKAGLNVAWDKYQEWGNKSEAANRMALYNQMRERKLTHLQASFAARDLLDFSMQGSWPAFRLVTQTVPFMNARVQGLYKLGRDGVTPTARVLYNTVTGKPIEQTDKQKAEAFGYTTLAVAGASMALYMIFKDDEDYKKRDEWDRDNFWWFKLPGMDFAFRVPKPFEIGAFGTMAERTLEQIIDQEAEGKQFADSIKRMLGDTFALNPVPQMFKPVLDLYANKDSFTGSPIESAGMERLSKQERAADTTSPLAIALGGMTAILGEKGELSPVQVDYAIKAYFGWLGSTAAVTSHYAVMPFREGDYPDAKWLDRTSLGLIKSLPSNQSRYATAFYENNRQISQAFADMRHYAESNQTDKVMEILEEKGDKIALAKMYDQTSKKMAAARKQIREVQASTALSGSDKREEIDRLKELIGIYAEQAESVRKSLK